MSCRIIINETTTWEAPEWIARTVAAEIHTFLAAEPLKDAVDQRLEIVHNDPDAACDFRDASGEVMETFYRATSLAHLMSKSRQTEWHKPESFPQFMNAFDQLITFLSKDERLKGVARPWGANTE